MFGEKHLLTIDDVIGQAGAPFCSLSLWERELNQSYKTSCNVKFIGSSEIFFGKYSSLVKLVLNQILNTLGCCTLYYHRN